jgi:hypothetical protein
MNFLHQFKLQCAWHFEHFRKRCIEEVDGRPDRHLRYGKSSKIWLDGANGVIGSATIHKHEEQSASFINRQRTIFRDSNWCHVRGGQAPNCARMLRRTIDLNKVSGGLTWFPISWKIIQLGY